MPGGRASRPGTGPAVGSSGITGGAIVRLLAGRGGEVVGLARRPGEAPEGTRTIAGDLLDPAGLAAALGGLAPTHVFYTSWSRRDTFADMGRSRDLGFTGHRRTEASFLRALDRYREARILP